MTRTLKTGTVPRTPVRDRDATLRVSRSDTPYQTLKLKRVVTDALKDAQRERAIRRAFKPVD